jgi:hypothetical protein
MFTGIVRLVASPAAIAAQQHSKTSLLEVFRMRRVWTIALTLGIVVLAGCGNSSPEQTAAKTDNAVNVDRENPCSVMLPTEIEEIFGVKSNLRETVDDITCHYHFEQADGKQLKSEDGESFIRVQIHWTDGKTVVMAQRLAGNLIGGADSGFEQLQNIGDEAWMAPLASYLTFSKGDVGVEIDLRLFPGERDKAIRLAQRIAERI